jgi:hypothetical protein
VSNVDAVGMPNVVVDGTSAHTTYTARPAIASTTPIHADQRRVRTSAPRA